uniref:Uncharacterized protein n=1 Tax=Peronospora matthiolae TaxID=2874970 RepID=A0AAV1TSG1_9STRA
MADDPPPLSKKLRRKQEKRNGWLAGCVQSFSIDWWESQVLTEASEIVSKPSGRTSRALPLRPPVSVLVHHVY